MRLEAFLLLLFFACLSCLTKTYLALVTKQSERHNITVNIPNSVPTATRQNVHYNLDVIKLNSKANEMINGGLTEWSNWSECSSACGRRTLRSRERYCSNPVPSNGGADCEGERFQLDMCEMLPCSSDLALSPVERHVIKNFHPWSTWSRCTCGKATQTRFRLCSKHSLASCFGPKLQRKKCRPRGCKILAMDKASVVDIDPKQICGFDPCELSKCLLSPLGSCVSDYKCRPVFFDVNNKRVDGCVGRHVYINPLRVSKLCKINPCRFTRCLMDFTEERCVVGTRCQAVYYSAEGRPQHCTAVLKVPARDVCGYDPCNTESCADNPNARCLVTSKCRPVFVNAFDERIRKCEEDNASKNNRIYDSNEEEFEAEPDDDDDDEDGDGNEENDELHDKQDMFNDDYETLDKSNDNRDSFIDKYASSDERYGSRNDHIGVDDADDDSAFEQYRPHTRQPNFGERNREEGVSDTDDDNDYDDDSIDDNYDNLVAHEASEFVGSEREKNSTRIHTANAQMKKNTWMFSNPLFKMPNVGDSDRRSTRSDRKNVSGVDPTTINLQDLVSGKLDNSNGLLVGTLKKSMKILSNRKPTTYYYFETKGRNPKENRQFMIITSQKSKKSNVHSREDVGRPLHQNNHRLNIH
ncbi:thrombospondin-2-like isoform X2 [Xenia sp. Carnegie-2017]|uniref:thrombospondin-2-like isoform X2 n=1 Tax=Xenia sp. Carnegie-2017 TaxID=2897299 RepID=UPI001F0459AA|nr:thrombospondin-2-like isoform X2 [Xenia sp. Carnegie-2017]